jgi:hypothetical protein
MRLVNVLLCLLVCVLIAAGTLELGLRLIGLGPPVTINRFDPNYGWSNTPSSKTKRSTGEFSAVFEINELGLRDDPMKNPGKENGVYRVLVLGDSFVLGYTVERKDLFVDLLEDWWRSEGRRTEVVNTGREGWSTDQEVLWYLREGRNFAADLVLLCPYENDLYWNKSPSYYNYPKPRFNPDGTPEQRSLLDPGPQPASERFATTRLAGQLSKETVRWSHPSRPDKKLEMEWGAYLHEPPEFMQEAKLRTRGALQALKTACEMSNTALYVAPIPNKACIEEGARRSLASQVGLDEKLWSPDQPVETFLALCGELSIKTLDARPALRAEAASGTPLYFQRDWHFDPHGNRAFARFLHAELDRAQVFPAAYAATKPASIAPEEAAGVPGWLKLYAVLLVVLSAIYKLTYREEPLWVAPLKVGAMLALVFAIALGGGRLLDLVPPKYARALLAMFVVGLFFFILYKLGRRLGTILELFAAFTRRGHWYLMPLVIVLLTIGSLLVVAASSPLVAPFIYTLF